MIFMSASNTPPPCLGELLANRPAGASGGVGRRPACDLAEGQVWTALGGGWKCLYGCYCQLGVSIEWHDFTCTEPREWSRSFHPGSAEVCLNISGRARLACGRETVPVGAMTGVIYHAGSDKLRAWRLPGEPHRFLTVEYSKIYLEEHLKGHEMSAHPVLRSVLREDRGDGGFAGLFRLTAALRKSIEVLRSPPVAGQGRNLWYQGKALELAAEFFFAGAADQPATGRRQTEAAQARARRVVEILARNLAEPPSIEELGREAGCSPYHLSRTFSRVMGLTIPQFLRQARMERAAELLRSGKFKVTEAALEVGYSSLSHFSLAFCETIGCCPGLYPLGVGRRAAQPVPARATNRQ